MFSVDHSNTSTETLSSTLKLSSTNTPQRLYSTRHRHVQRGEQRVQRTLRVQIQSSSVALHVLRLVRQLDELLRGLLLLLLHALDHLLQTLQTLPLRFISSILSHLLDALLRNAATERLVHCQTERRHHFSLHQIDYALHTLHTLRYRVQCHLPHDLYPSLSTCAKYP